MESVERVKKKVKAKVLSDEFHAQTLIIPQSEPQAYGSYPRNIRVVFCHRKE